MAWQEKNGVRPNWNRMVTEENTWEFIRQVNFPRITDFGQYVILVSNVFSSRANLQKGPILAELGKKWNKGSILEKIGFTWEYGPKEILILSMVNAEDAKEIRQIKEFQFEDETIYIRGATAEVLIGVTVTGLFPDEDFSCVNKVLEKYATIESVVNGVSVEAGMEAIFDCKFKYKLKLRKDATRDDLPQRIRIGRRTINIFVPGAEKKCFYCEEMGHFVRVCPRRKCIRCNGFHGNKQECLKMDMMNYENSYPTLEEVNTESGNSNFANQEVSNGNDLLKSTVTEDEMENRQEENEKIDNNIGTSEVVMGNPQQILLAEQIENVSNLISLDSQNTVKAANGNSQDDPGKRKEKEIMKTDQQDFSLVVHGDYSLEIGTDNEKRYKERVDDNGSGVKLFKKGLGSGQAEDSVAGDFSTRHQMVRWKPRGTLRHQKK